jgi:bifunctional DNA-binding transcriptional regulator/antitoxin component of YhaV-PrlF toxin-antitoxin module
MHVVRMSSRGQILIPKEVRRKHQLDKDTDLLLQDAGGILILRKKKHVDKALRSEFYPLLKASEKSLGELWDNPEDDVWNEA